MRKSYSSEFKLKAASMVLDEGQPVTEVCASLDIGPTALRRWVHKMGRIYSQNGTDLLIK